MTEQETRPRSFADRDGLFVILRGVNLNPGADPEDMVSMRMWIEERRVITLRRRRVMAIEDLRPKLAEVRRQSIGLRRYLAPQRDVISHLQFERVSWLDEMDRRMYALSVIAGIFLPLSFLTGLLGINVGGIPGTDSATAFTLVCIGLLALAGAQGWLFRRLRWL